MATPFDEELARELEGWEARGLRRRIDDVLPDGAVDFVSNDYLGLLRHPALIEAAREAAARHGVGAGASRLLGGASEAHREAEAQAAGWLGAESALLFPSGYQANLGVVTALVGPGDVIFSDALNHASLIDAARLSRAHVSVFRHNDVAHLESLLASASGARRRLVVVEGVYSMDGDVAPLAELASACLRHRAGIVVDEAHAVGLLGQEGAGAWSAADPDPAALVARVLTAGKSLACSGALIVGSGRVRELMIHRARSFVFTTSPSPVIAATVARAIPLVRESDALRSRTLANAARLADGLGCAAPAAAIVPAVIGDNERTVALAAELQRDGFAVRAVRPPTVPPGTARLRLVARAPQTDEQIDSLCRVVRPRLSPPPKAARAQRAEPLFVVGTDTEIGKTVVSALLVRAAKANGVGYWKPVQTGAEDDSDTATVRELAELVDDEISPEVWALPLPASPHTAAEDAGVEIDPEVVMAALDPVITGRTGHVIVEFAGGLLVPYTHGFTQADWLSRRRPPFVLVARSGLGTLNHTMLTLESLRARHLEPRAMFLVGDRHEANRATLAATSGVRAIYEVPRFARLDAAALDAWLADNDLTEVFR